MKLNEFFGIERRIFTDVFEPVFSTEYQNIFGTIDPTLLDDTVLMRYGNKTLAMTFNNDNYKAIIKAVISVNVDSWNKQANTLNLDYNILNQKTKETVLKVTESSKNDSSGTDENQSVTFNNSEYGNNERTNRTSADTTDREQNTTYSESGFVGGGNITASVKEEMKFRQNNLRSQVIKELVGEITLSIYSEDY